MNRLGRLLVTLLRGALGLCALVLVLAALYVSLGRELVPLVAEYRDEVQAKAATALNMPVSIGSLEGRWRGGSPLLLAHDVMIGSGASSVRLDQVRVVPDVLASLLARKPRIAHLQVDGLQLSVRQDESGAWRVEGLPTRDPSAPMDPQKVLQGMQVIERLSLLDSQITLEPFEQPPLSFTYANLTLRNGPTRQRIDARLLLPDGQPLALRLRSRLQPAEWRNSEAELYVSLPQSEWARWLPKGLTRDWRLQKLQAGGEFWLDWKQGQVQRAVARLHAPELVAGYAERKPVEMQDLVFSSYFTRTESGFDLLFDSLALSLGETRWGDVKLAVAHRLAAGEEDERWRITADRLQLDPLGGVIQALAPLPPTGAEALQALNPRGTLSNIQLDVHPTRTDAKRVQYFGNLTRVSISPWHGIPAVENVSGSVVGDIEDGEGRSVSENFGLHFDQLFPEIWRYRQAAAQINWHYDAEGLTLRSPYLQVVGEEGRIAGDFLVRLLKDPEREDYMDLRVGIRDGDAKFTGKYLPTLSPGMSPKLSEWLNTAIRGGKVDEGYFQYQGSLAKGADAASRALSLYFRVHDAELAFQPGWPALRDARGEVLIEDSGVRVRAPHGLLLESQVSDVDVAVPHVDAGQTSRLLITGNLQSSVPDALKILQETPLGTADVFAGWSGDGALQGKLDLNIPLVQGQPPAVKVDFASDNANLKLSTLNLDLRQIKGDFRYDTARGLSAPDIRAQVFGRAVRGKALAEGSGGKARSRVEANGRVPLKDLAGWLGATKPLPLAGEVPYALNLVLDGADSQLRINSDLKGLAVNLPAPYGKSAEQSVPTSWRMTLQGAERRYWLNYGELAKLAFASPAGQIMEGRGQLRLGGGDASLPGGKGLRVDGSISELDWNAWQAAVKPYTGEQTARPAMQVFRGADLRIGHFVGLGQDLKDLSLQLARGDGTWSLDLDSSLLQGNVLLPDAKAAPIVVNLQRLSFPPARPPSEEQAPDEPDPLASFDPRQVPAVDVRIDRVLQGDQLLGAWSLKARPNANGVAFSELSIDLKGLLLKGSGGWEGAPGSTTSWYKGRMEGKDLSNVLLAWHFAPSATSKRFRVDADGRWPGSPAWFSLKRFSGSLDASLRDGQFVEVQGSATALRVFGLLNFNSIGRRLRLDFSDLLGKGLSYDQVKGVLVANNGVFVTRDPIKMEGPSTGLELDGTLDMVKDRIDAELLVTLPVTNNLPLAALIVGAPAIGGALFVVDKLLGDRVARFASVQYKVEGTMKNPEITFDKPFEKPH
ncbi:TIGR02099 family protein [Pseudomonas sp. PDM14]|uniref:YhdP family protein n=1 Tax=Pseudomonas sp. PDM14 TaxID=2769288 RepID=UPI0017854F29|nr:YhdP family protein [Pseudomonas sp. PDM14]MBD9485464.1 TIGR02099 family protein [Pseudomonas sp. PDM14]